MPRTNATHTDLRIIFLCTIKVPCFICMMIKCETSVCLGFLICLSLPDVLETHQISEKIKKNLFVCTDHFWSIMLILGFFMRLGESWEQTTRRFWRIWALQWSNVCSEYYAEFCVSTTLICFLSQNVQFCNENVCYCELNGERTMFILPNFTLALCEKKKGLWNGFAFFRNALALQFQNNGFISSLLSVFVL